MADFQFSRRSAPWVVGQQQQTPWTGVTKPAKKCKNSVLDLIHQVNKIEENTAFYRKEEYVTEPKKSLRILHEKYAQSLRNEKRLRILLTWLGFARQAKQSRHLGHRIRILKQQFKLKLILMEWHSVAVRQPRIMLNAHKRLQRKPHHSLSFVSAQYGVYAHYWLRALLLSWKRLLFDAPGGFLLHRGIRLKRQQTFGNALATSTSLLTRTFEVEEKGSQCSFRSREETVYKEKVEEFIVVEKKNKEEREETTKKQEILIEHLTKLKSDYEALHKAFLREKQISADAQKQVERMQSLQTLKEYTKGDMGRMATEMKEFRERAMEFPQSFTCPVVATINNIHQIELRNILNTEKIIAPVSHRISSCKLEGDCLLVYENEGVLIRFDSERSSNLCIISSMLARMIEERDEFMSTSINVNHKESKDSQCQIEMDRLHGNLAAAKQKVDILLDTAREDVEKKSIEALMDEERPDQVGQEKPSFLLKQPHSVSLDRKVSLDQQAVSLNRKVSLDQHAASLDRKVSLDQQVSPERNFSQKQQASLDRKVSLDQQVSPERNFSQKQQASLDRKVSLDQQVMLMGEIQSSMSKQKEREEHKDQEEQEMMTELFSRLKTNHRVSEANIGIIEEI